MANFDLPIGVLRRPVEPGSCSLCPDGGRGKATSFCTLLETTVCDDCCSVMWQGDPYRLLSATSLLRKGQGLGELMRACLHCRHLHEAAGDSPPLPN